MQTLFFADYIKSPIFIQHLSEELADHDLNFDVIASDIHYSYCPILQISPKNKSDSVSLIDARKDAISAAKHPLIILNQLNIDFCKPIFDLYQNGNISKNITIINLYAGIGSIGNKVSLEFNDLDFIPEKFDKYEAIDLENMWNILKKGGLQYIRCTYREMPDAIFDVNELGIIDSSMLNNLDTISLKTYGFWGNNATIFTSGSLFNLAIQTGEILQNAQKECGFFIFQKLDSKRSEEMIENIKNSKKLCILIDHANSEVLQEYFKNQLKNSNLNDVELKFLTPEYKNLTTIFDEYQEEQTEIDPESLAKRI